MSVGNWNKLREYRGGICLHYDGSASDKGSITWLTKDPACKVSYNYLFLDDGSIIQIAPDDARAWHAGVCRPSSEMFKYKDANSYFYGLAIAASGKDTITQLQFDALVKKCVELFYRHGWTEDDSWRITSHSKEAWPRGRKVDVEGVRIGDPVCSLDAVRHAVVDQLRRQYEITPRVGPL